jgi:hypothetical protein
MIGAFRVALIFFASDLAVRTFAFTRAVPATNAVVAVIRFRTIGILEIESVSTIGTVVALAAGIATRAGRAIRIF